MTGNSHALSALVSVLREIDPGRPTQALVPSGHYASVLPIDERNCIAVCTDGVGTKVIVAEQARRFETIGIDCVAMNVNDVICVGAEPIAMVDYLAVEKPEPEILRQIGLGLKEGAERAGIEIPGGELAELPEVIRGHPSPLGFDLAGACFGVVAGDRVVSGSNIHPGDAVIGLPSSGIHSNGLALARRSLLEQGGYSLEQAPAELGRALVDELLAPTEIYVRPVIELLRSGNVDVRGLAHITGDGLLNLLRLNPRIGYEIDEPLSPQPIFGLIESAGNLDRGEMYESFNMGTGFCCVVAAEDVRPALALLQVHYPSAQQIGRVTEKAGEIRLPSLGLVGHPSGFAGT